MTLFESFIALSLIVVIVCIAFVVVNTWFPQKPQTPARVEPDNPWPRAPRKRVSLNPASCKTEESEKLRLDLIRQFHE